MRKARRTVLSRGFSIVEALVAMGLVILALVGLFGVMPYTYRTLQDDSLRTEAATAAQRYLDDVRLAVQAGEPVPGPTEAPLQYGNSIATGQQISDTAFVDLSAFCEQIRGPASSLYDCTVSLVLDAGGARRPLAPLETFVARQLP
jgi:type II secretory pathway pseudopilin PulG